MFLILLYTSISRRSPPFPCFQENIFYRVEVTEIVSKASKASEAHFLDRLLKSAYRHVKQRKMFPVQHRWKVEAGRQKEAIAFLLPTLAHRET